MRRLLVLLSVLAVAIVAVLGQTVETVADRIDRQRFEFPQEKIHVMTDRGSYMAGDTIWLRAWGGRCHNPSARECQPLCLCRTDVALRLGLYAREVTQR